MKKFLIYARNIISVLVGGISWFVGGLDGFLIVLIIMCVCDYLTGLACGKVNKKLSSAVGFIGIIKKVVMFMIVGIMHKLDEMLHSGDALRNATIFFYISNEGLSIVENAAILGLPIPDTLLNALEQIKKRSKDTGNDESEKAGDKSDE